LWIHGCHWLECSCCNKAISAARDGLDETRVVGVVSKCGANLVDGKVDAPLKIDECVVAPDVLVDFFAGDKLSRAICQEQENGKLLRLQPDQVAAFAQLTIDGIECEGAEAN
jgi:hypothetical protein